MQLVLQFKENGLHNDVHHEIMSNKIVYFCNALKMIFEFMFMISNHPGIKCLSNLFHHSSYIRSRLDFAGVRAHASVLEDAASIGEVGRGLMMVLLWPH